MAAASKYQINYTKFEQIRPDPAVPLIPDSNGSIINETDAGSTLGTIIDSLNLDIGEVFILTIRGKE